MTFRDAAIEAGHHSIERIAHDTQRRECSVVQVRHLASRMRRVVLGGAALEGFYSRGFDDHVKLILPTSVAEGEPVARDYTPRRFDPVRRELTIDMALHGDGPATRWAERAKPGDSVVVAGPRRSAIVSETFDWWLLVGDETALPAIARRLEESPRGLATSAIVLVNGCEDEFELTSAARLELQWVHRTRRRTLLGAVQRWVLPPGDGFVWIACEATLAKSLRACLIDKGAAARWMKAAAYWRRGAVAAHEALGS